MVAVALVAAIGGVMLAAWGLWSDRSSGRRRCPRCWYDLRGTPGMRCSECGREGRSERDFSRSRRRRPAVAAAVVLAMLGVACYLMPQVRRDGWLSLVPTDVLLRMAPQAGAESTLIGLSSTTNPVVVELVRRHARAHLAPRQWRYILEHMGVIRSRAQWPIGASIVVDMTIPCWIGACEITATPRIADSRPAAVHLLDHESSSPDPFHPQLGRASRVVGSATASADHLDFDCEVVFLIPQSYLTTDCGLGFDPEVPVNRKFSKRMFAGVIRLPVRIDATPAAGEEPLDSASRPP